MIISIKIALVLFFIYLVSKEMTAKLEKELQKNKELLEEKDRQIEDLELKLILERDRKVLDKR